MANIWGILINVSRINRYANKFKYWDEPKEDKQ